MNSLSAELFATWYIKTLRSWVIWYKKPRYIPQILLWRCVYKDIQVVFADISKLRYTKRDSIYDWEQDVLPDKYRKRALFNTDSFLATKCNCWIQEVGDILTNEQIGFIMDDSKRDFYESFDKWKDINDDILISKWRNLTQQQAQVLEYMKAYKEREKEYLSNNWNDGRSTSES